MDIQAKFAQECAEEIERQGQDEQFAALSQTWLQESTPHKYSYHFSWLGRPIIQYPQDIIAVQELVWRCKPDLIIETGIAHGGSLIFNASLLELNALCGGPAEAHVLGIDIDIRSHNRRAIEEHPLFHRISMLEGSSVDSDIIDKVHKVAKKYSRIMLMLDSNHTHEHVLAELNAYAHLVSVGSYSIVFDTLVAYMPDDFYPNRPWGKGNNPLTAVQEFLKSHPEFLQDASLDRKLLLSAAPGGYLRRIK